VAELLYGSGLQLMEALRLWVQDLDFERRELTVRDGKGGKDRRTMWSSHHKPEVNSVEEDQHLFYLQRPTMGKSAWPYSVL